MHVYFREIADISGMVKMAVSEHDSQWLVRQTRDNAIKAGAVGTCIYQQGRRIPLDKVHRSFIGSLKNHYAWFQWCRSQNTVAVHRESAPNGGRGRHQEGNRGCENIQISQYHFLVITNLPCVMLSVRLLPKAICRGKGSRRSRSKPRTRRGPPSGRSWG